MFAFHNKSDSGLSPDCAVIRLGRYDGYVSSNGFEVYSTPNSGYFLIVTCRVFLFSVDLNLERLLCAHGVTELLEVEKLNDGHFTIVDVPLNADLVPLDVVADQTRCEHQGASCLPSGVGNSCKSLVRSLLFSQKVILVKAEYLASLDLSDSADVVLLWQSNCNSEALIQRHWQEELETHDVEGLDDTSVLFLVIINQNLSLLKTRVLCDGHRAFSFVNREVLFVVGDLGPNFETSMLACLNGILKALNLETDGCS